MKKILIEKSSFSINVQPGEGLAQVFFLNQKVELFLLTDKSSLAELSNQSASIESIKYVGDKACYSETIEKESMLISKVIKKLFFNHLVTAWYYPEKNVIRVPKTVEANVIPMTETILENRKIKKKRVLIVDDSSTIQKLLTKIITKSEMLEVMACASSPSEALSIIKSETPDLITLDIHMPEMTGVDFLKLHLKNLNIPVVIVSSVSMAEGPLVMDALANGAIDYIQKPVINQMHEIEAMIIEKLESISRSNKIVFQTSSKKKKTVFNNTEGLVVIGSSTGGTQALQEIFTNLPDEIPPILVVQHIPAVFSKALADRLNALCKFEIKEAVDHDLVKKNCIYIAPGGTQMRLIKRGNELRLNITDDPPVNRFKPSVDYLFDSVAQIAPNSLIGVILTGMGKDGAKGLLALKKIGAITIAQDEASSIVFGMPKEAIAIGGASLVVPLPNIAETLVMEHSKQVKKMVS